MGCGASKLTGIEPIKRNLLASINENEDGLSLSMSSSSSCSNSDKHQIPNSKKTTISFKRPYRVKSSIGRKFSKITPKCSRATNNRSSISNNLSPIKKTSKKKTREKRKINDFSDKESLKEARKKDLFDWSGQTVQIDSDNDELDSSFRPALDKRFYEKKRRINHLCLRRQGKTSYFLNESDSENSDSDHSFISPKRKIKSYGGYEEFSEYYF